MRQTNTRTVAEQKPLGVIDSISAGLALVWRRPWTLLIPILIDLMIWVLPRLSLTQLLRPYANDILTGMTLASDPQTAEETRRAFQQTIESFNLLGFVTAALNGVTRLPSLLAVDAADVTSPINAWAYAIPLQSASLLLLLSIPLFLLGLLVVAIYLEMIAQGVRPLETSAPTVSIFRTARLWLRLILFSLLLLGMLFAALLVLMLLQLLFNNLEIGAFATVLITIGFFWLFIYLFFVPSATAVSDVGIRKALRRSTLLFRAFFWSTLGLVALSVFLDRGLALIWDGFTVGSIGVLIGILANSFIGTALIAASMVYYQDRMNVFERMKQAIKTTKSK